MVSATVSPEAIRRLDASRRKLPVANDAIPLAAEAEQAGQVWAGERATYHQLSALVTLQDGAGGAGAVLCPNDTITAVEQAILLAGLPVNCDTVSGFADGARLVWEAVRGRL